MTQYPTIRQGGSASHKEAVKALQRLLHLTTDGIFGPLTTEALKDWQTAHGLQPDGICGPKTWAALLEQEAKVSNTKPDGDDPDMLLADVDLSAVRPATRRTISEIIVHCSATPEGKDFTVKDIDLWHRQRGFAGIGYHYVIYRDGKIHNGRDINTIGAHCVGHNAHSIGICYIGGMDAANKQAADTRTEAQHKSLLALLVRLCKLYPKAKLYGHRELSRDQNGDGIISPWEFEKQCPSFDVSTLRTELRKRNAYKY